MKRETVIRLWCVVAGQLIALLLTLLAARPAEGQRIRPSRPVPLPVVNADDYGEVILSLDRRSSIPDYRQPIRVEVQPLVPVGALQPPLSVRHYRGCPPILPDGATCTASITWIRVMVPDSWIGDGTTHEFYRSIYADRPGGRLLDTRRVTVPFPKGADMVTSNYDEWARAAMAQEGKR